MSHYNFSAVTPRHLRTPPAVRRTESSMKEPTTNFNVLYSWGGGPDPQGLWGLHLHHWCKVFWIIGTLLLAKMGEKYRTDKSGAAYVNEIQSFYSGSNLEDQSG